MEHSAIDHRVEQASVAIEARFFNSMLDHSPSGGMRETVLLEAGATVADVIRELGLPGQDIHLILKNGCPVEPAAAVNNGDRIAFSGPVPFNWRI